MDERNDAVETTVGAMPVAFAFSGFAVRLSDAGAAVTSIVPLNDLPFAFGSEYEYLPAVANVQLPLAPGCTTNGFGVHVTPAVDLNVTWWTTVSLFVNCTVSP